MSEKLTDRLRDDSWRGRDVPQNELEVWHSTCCEAAEKIESLQARLGDQWKPKPSSGDDMLVAHINAERNRTNRKGGAT